MKKVNITWKNRFRSNSERIASNIQFLLTYKNANSISETNGET